MTKQSEDIRTPDELPLFLKAEHISQATVLSKPIIYNLMNSNGFPSLRVGNRVLVGKNAFKDWLSRSAQD